MKIVPIIAAAVMLSAAPLLAQQTSSQPIIYPSKGQSAEQQSKDEAECYTWAKSNTGIDPAVVASNNPAPADTGPQGERVRGAARGAAAGAIIGEIANDDAGKGAAIGAATGVMAGGARNRQRQSDANAQQKQQQAEKQQQMDTYNRARNACMEGRGYTIK